MADVDLLVHQGQGLNSTRARALPPVIDERSDLIVLEPPEEPHGFFCVSARPEDGELALHLEPISLFRPSPWIVGSPHGSRESAPKNERGSSSRMCCCEEKAHRHALG